MGKRVEINLDGLVRWLSDVRWWPKNCSIVFPPDVEIHRDGEYLFLLLTDSCGNKYFVPLKKLSSDVRTTRSVEIGGNIYAEADLVEPFLLSARDILDHEDIYALPNCRFDRVDLLRDSSNVVVVASSDGCYCRAVLKSYRVVSKDRVELKILAYLSSKGFSHIPKIYSVYRYKGCDIGLAMEYIEGVDGGTPFYKSLIDFLKNFRKDYIHSLGYTVGKTVAELHKVFAVADDIFFSSEPLTDYDVELMRKRLDEISDALLHNLDSLHTGGRIDGFWIEIADRRIPIWIDKASNMFTALSGSRKIVCHRDLHLSQMIYSASGRFYIVDFEGEPLFLYGEKHLKFHGLMDIASLIRSLDYILFTGVREVYGGDTDYVAKKFVRSGWGIAGLWRDSNAISIVKGYIDTLARESLLEAVLGFKTVAGDLDRYIIPWYVYRVLYEALYESTYRPHNLPIPLHVLIWDPEDIVIGGKI